MKNRGIFTSEEIQEFVGFRWEWLTTDYWPFGQSSCFDLHLPMKFVQPHSEYLVAPMWSCRLLIARLGGDFQVDNADASSFQIFDRKLNCIE